MNVVMTGSGRFVEIQGTGLTPAENAPLQEGLLAPSIEELEEIVAMVPNPAEWGWHRMVEFGYAVKAAGADDEATARGFFLAWCATEVRLRRQS